MLLLFFCPPLLLLLSSLSSLLSPLWSLTLSCPDVVRIIDCDLFARIRMRLRFKRDVFRSELAILVWISLMMQC
jgi:hypothetical protein